MSELDRSRGGAQPVLTYYDDATGERTELSAATLDNWVAKTANLIVDGHGLGPGDTARVLLPPHWQTAGVLLGCRAAGLSIVDRGHTDIAFVAADRTGEADADEVYAVALSPFATPMRPAPPPGIADYNVEVRAYGDRFAGARPTTTGTGRILVDADAHPDPADWLFAPLTAGASVVLCRHLDPTRLDARIATERVTTLLTGDGPPPVRRTPPATPG